MLGHHWPTSETSFKCRRWPIYSGMLGCLSPHQLKKRLKFGPPLTKLSGSAHEMYNFFVELDTLS